MEFDVNSIRVGLDNLLVEERRREEKRMLRTDDQTDWSYPDLVALDTEWVKRTGAFPDEGERR
jgi:hypothetical protein